jgi:hypothetical protein
MTKTLISLLLSSSLLSATQKVMPFVGEGNHEKEKKLNIKNQSQGDSSRSGIIASASVGTRVSEMCFVLHRVGWG